MKKLFASRLQWQYFASYLLVMLTIMAVFFVYTYQSLHRYHVTIELGNYTNRLELVRHQEEAVIQDMVSIANHIMNVTSTVPFEYKESPDKALAMIRYLKTYRSVHDSLAGLYIHFYHDEFVYASTGLYTMDRFICDALKLESMTPEQMKRLLEDTKHITLLPMQRMSGYIFEASKQGDRRVIMAAMPVSISSGLHCGTALFIVDTTTYLQWFDDFAGPEVDLYILDHGQLHVSRSVSGIPFEQVQQALEMNRKQLKYEGNTYHLLHVDGQTFDRQYVLLLPDAQVQLGFSGSVLMLMVLAAVVGALGIVTIHYMVQRRMKMIRLLHHMISDREPTSNELVEIRDGIQHLLDANAAMSSQMENVESLRKSDFVRKFLVGDFASEDEYLSCAESIQVNVDTAYYVVAILAKPADSSYELTTDKINHLFDGDVTGVARMLVTQERMALIAFGDDVAALMNCMEQKFLGLRACCIGITMAVSAVHSDYREGQRAYLEAENAFELRFVKGNARPLRFASAEVKPSSSGYDPKLVNRLETALHAGDSAQIGAVLRDISRAMRETQASLFEFRCMYNEILNVVSNEVRQQGIKDEVVYDLFKLSQCLSLEDLDQMLHSVCVFLVGRQQENAAPEISDEMTKAREIIESRFSEPGLSVSSVAESLGMSDSRLSTEFKKVWRMTPLEFITLSRIRRARKLLRTTEMPVKDIAVECGYYDISGFNRRFKAYTGMTPKQYRQSDDAPADADGENGSYLEDAYE